MAAEGGKNTGFLAATPTRVAGSALVLLGLKHKVPDFFAVAEPAPWDRWGAWQGALLLALVPALALGVAVLARRARLALLVAAGLAPGTLLTAVAVNAITPSYAERTVLPAVLGWALVAGAAVGQPRPHLPSLAGSPRWASAASPWPSRSRP